MKKLLMAGLAILIALSFAACAKKEGGAAAQAAGRYADQLYVEVSALNSLEYFYDHKEGMRLVGEDLGVKTEYTGPADYDMNAVAAAIDQAVAKKAAGIVVVGWEESLNGAINKAIEAGRAGHHRGRGPAHLQPPGLRRHLQLQRRRGARQVDDQEAQQQGHRGHARHAHPVQHPRPHGRREVRLRRAAA